MAWVLHLSMLTVSNYAGRLESQMYTPLVLVWSLAAGLVLSSCATNTPKAPTDDFQLELMARGWACDERGCYAPKHERHAEVKEEQQERCFDAIYEHDAQTYLDAGCKGIFDGRTFEEELNFNPEND